MVGKISLILISGFLLISPPPAAGQDDQQITIVTSPPGATVFLYGEMDLIANTPARLPLKLSGRYQAKITRPGYETWKGDLTFVPGSNNNFEIKMTRKSRLKAGLRSVFVPGWGQIYSGKKTGGIMLTSGAAVSAVAVYFTDSRYKDKFSDYNIAIMNYTNAVSIEDRIRYKTILDDKQRTAYRAETDRRIAIAAAGALWVFNVLDAVLFFPETDLFYPTVASIDGGAQLTFTVRF